MRDWDASHRRWPWVVAWWLLAVLACVLIARAELARLRAEFETESRIAHRLHSQRAAQHDAILATLSLLQPEDAAGAVQRLPALYPQVLAVRARERGQAWADPAWQAAEARSRERGHAVIAASDLAAGRVTLLRASDPSSFALELDLRRPVPGGEWPWGDATAVRARLALGAAGLALSAGPDAAQSPWRFDFRKALASDSQPLELQAERGAGWAELPWGRMVAAALLLALGLGTMRAALAQRTARRRAEELLRLGQVARLNTLGELAAGMAHELNQPLTAVLAGTRAASRLLAEDPPDLGLSRQAMDHAAAQARRASEVLARLRRTVERPDAQATPQPVALADAVRDALHLLQPECDRRGVVARLEAEPGLPSVAADPVALQQIVHNLVMNALQALEQMPAGQRELVLAIAAGADGRVELAVRDSGPGIAPEALPRLFEPFFSTRSGGLGLGLSLCETLALGLGGRLSAANREPRGAQFTLSLPSA